MKKYVIYGLGISGISAIKYFASKGEKVIATDDNQSSIENAKAKLNLKNVEFLSSDEIDYDSNTIIIFAPGIPLYFTKPHKILQIVDKTSAKLVCDLEAFYQENQDHQFIGVTGTNGKSTTSSLIDFTLKEIGIEANLGGNIGIPCFDIVNVASQIIFEISSYQLDLIDKLKFNISALTNITPDHIDRHGSFENYIESKKKIFLNQKEGDFALINIDDENCHKIYEELKNDPDFKAKLIPISSFKESANGISLIDGKLSYFSNQASLKSEFLQGKHNEQNIAFAFAICYLIDKDKTQEIIAGIKKFTGLKHRMQIVDQFQDITFVNDSKATNVESAKHSLRTFDNIFWILGGVPKDDNLQDLEESFHKIKKAYLIGEASDSFAEILEKNHINFEKCNDLDNAFEKAFFDAKNDSLLKKNILLSPCCASFDQWKNFEKRGDHFCKLVNEAKSLPNH